MKRRWICVLSAAILLGIMTGCSNVRSAEEETQELEESLESQSTQDFYWMCNFSKDEVEDFAKEVKQQILDYDWEGLSEKILYPITIGEMTYETKEKFAAEEFTFDDRFRKLLQEESCEDMFCNWQGMMLGETGQVWISEFLNEDLSSQGLKVYGINGLLNKEAAEAKKKNLTMEQVIEIASQPKDFLVLNEELRPYWIHEPDRELDEHMLSYTTTYSIWYQEEEYLLDIVYMKKWAELDMVLLWRVTDGDSIVLYFAERPYKNVHQADGKEVEAFLEHHRQMSDYMTAELPENLTVGQFNAGIGNGGGSFLISSNMEDNAYIEDLMATVDQSSWPPSEWCSIGGMCCCDGYELEWENETINRISYLSNHRGFVGTGEILEGCEVPARLELVFNDLYTAATLYEAEKKYGEIPEEKWHSYMWYVYFAKPESKNVYAVWLNADLYSKEEIIAFAESVRFTESAFEN